MKYYSIHDFRLANGIVTQLKYSLLQMYTITTWMTNGYNIFVTALILQSMLIFL